MKRNNPSFNVVLIIFFISITISLLSGCKDKNDDDDNPKLLPVVETVGAPIVENSSATCYGLVGSDNGFTVTERGFCYSTGITPTLSDDHIICGAGSGSFEGIITDLLASTRYYVRAFATNAKGTAYGSTISFITGPPDPPIMKLYDATHITGNSASVRFMISSSTGNIINEYGICYSTTENPDINSLHVSKSDEVLDAIFRLTDLEQGNTYYFRGYSIVGNETIYYSDQKMFENTPGFEIITDINGNSYITRMLNNKIWMFEDLKVSQLNDGTPIMDVSEYQWPYDGLAYYKYKNLITSDSGLIYNYDVIMSSNVCPDGWHVSTRAEWENLFEFINGDLTILKSNGFSSKSNALIDDVGNVFSDVLPEDLIQLFWTGDESSIVWIIMNNSPEITENCEGFGVSIRCVKD